MRRFLALILVLRFRFRIVIRIGDDSVVARVGCSAL